ncbi:MAG: hypothetical protein ACP5T4_02475 [Candidatus Micrarchaeia archaeon]
MNDYSNNPSYARKEEDFNPFVAYTPAAKEYVGAKIEEKKA